MDRYKQYVENAVEKGQKVEHHYSNGLDYAFVYEDSGWITIFDTTGGEYSPVIQAVDINHALEFIGLREPVPCGIEPIEVELATD